MPSFCPAKTIVVGARGFLGSYFFDFYRDIYPDTVGTHYQPLRGFFKLDIANNGSDFLRLPLQGYKYALLAAGVSNPQRCEKDPATTHLVNVEGVLALCERFLAHQITPILLSSGYVFDGVKGGYIEEDPYSPINVYGCQKVELEKRALQAFGDQCLIVRVAKVYGMQKGDRTLIDEIASLLSEGKKVKAASDQVLSPIVIDDIIQGIVALQHNECSGLYHLGGMESINRYEMALKVARALQVDESLVEEISLHEISLSFPRPQKSDLVSNKILARTGMHMSSLENSIEQIVNQYRVMAVT